MLEVGMVGKPHGLAGDVMVTLTSDRTERLDVGSVLDTDQGPLVVESSARHSNRWRVRFRGVHGREAAEAIRGLVLRAEPIEDPDTWFVHQLIDAEVRTIDGTVVGTCVAVIDNPAHDLLELDDATLIPLPFVTSVDLDADPVVVSIDPPAGLLPSREGH